MNFNRQILSERIQYLRISRNLSQKQLANGLGVSQQTVGHWETCFRLPSLEIAIALADYFDVSLDYLVGRSDDPTRN